MNKEKPTADEIREIIAHELNVPVTNVKDDLGAGDLIEWDSLGHMRIITAIENRFGKKIEEEKLFELETVADLINAFGKIDRRKKNFY